MEIAGLVIAAVAALLVFKFVKGMIKFAVLAVVVLVGLYMAGVFN
jgi:hypothetical protein